MTICQALRVSGRECLPYSSGQLALCWTLVITWSERGSVQSWNSRHDLWMKWGQQGSGKTRDELDMTAVEAALEVWPHSFEGSFWNPIWKGVWPLDALLLSGVVLLLNRTLQGKLIYFRLQRTSPGQSHFLEREWGQSTWKCFGNNDSINLMPVPGLWALLQAESPWKLLSALWSLLKHHLSESVPERTDPRWHKVYTARYRAPRTELSKNSVCARKRTWRVFCS